MDLGRAKKIMGQNLIGPEELNRISRFLNIGKVKKTPTVGFSEQTLKKVRRTHLLVLGVAKNKNNKSLTINRLRSWLGTDPAKSEPCFYNQDWYLKEKFAEKTTLANHWYLISKMVLRKSLGKNSAWLKNNFSSQEKFPMAILATFTFFAYYFLKKKLLWPKNFIWCSDLDHRGDRIYVGRYHDHARLNKNGFNIHRHLSVNADWGLAPEIN